MISADDITARREAIAAQPELAALRDRLIERARPVIERMPHVPEVKAALTRDGGVCPSDGSPLEFDPWSPFDHRCPACGTTARGERHHAHWARAQHLWIAERAAHLATVHAVTGDGAAANRARELLAAYYERYFVLPNRDNVLGPGHLFFSTYLESIWILDYLAAAILLRETGVLDDGDIDAVNAIADEAATLIGEFDEGMSNRQTWHAAALTAIAVWFGDEELATTAITGRTGLLGHLADGFGDDGMWHEGENYHLFAMRGLLIGLHWSAAAGAELLHDPELAAHLGTALMAPAATALPDNTFPARKDSRYGVSLAHPAYLESWEAGATLLGDAAPPALDPWIAALYATTPRRELQYDAYLHEAGEPEPTQRTRSDLSWWAMWMLRGETDTGAGATPSPHRAQLLEQQGVAVIRDGDRYVALECIGGGSGHGHPDRLHLTLHADGVHWLPDPGTGSYVAPDLFWYRSTLAHNAPRTDEQDQAVGETAVCTAFESAGEWTHVRSAWGVVERTIVTGPRWIIDVVVTRGDSPSMVELAWHPAGVLEVPSDGTDAALASEFVTRVRELACPPGEPLIARSGDKVLALHLHGGSVIAAEGPGLPGTAERTEFLVQRATGPAVRFTAVIVPGGQVQRVDVTADGCTVHDASGATTVTIGPTETVITEGTNRITLAGLRQRARTMPTLSQGVASRAHATAMRVIEVPANDGSLEGFDLAAPLTMDDELSYFRSETPYPGPDQFSAQAWVNWDIDVLYVAVEVTATEVVLRDVGAPPLLLDNEPDDIHASGVQLYYRAEGDAVRGVLIRPSRDGAQVRGIGEATPEGVHAAWQRTATGYVVTAALPCAGLGHRADGGATIEFDVVVNEMYHDRVRRAGQLAWSGGPGWVYLRGDRHDASRLGVLELHE